MSKKFKFEVVSPTGIFFEDEVDFIRFRALNGDMGVMANHEPMLVANRPSTLEIEIDNVKKYAFISEGFIEITKDKVSAIVDFAGWSDNLNVEKILRDQREAEEALETTKEDLEKKAELVASIERSKEAMKSSKLRN